MITIGGRRYRWTIRATLKRLFRKLYRRTLCELRGHRMEYTDFATDQRCCFWCGWNTQDLVKRRVNDVE